MSEAALSAPPENLDARMLQVEANAYPERDSGDWYAVWAGGGGRLAEDFGSADQCKRLILWLCGDPLPDGWKISRSRQSGIDIEMARHKYGAYVSFVWRKDSERYLTSRRERGLPAVVLPCAS